MKYVVGILNWVKTNKTLSLILITAITISLTQIFKAKNSNINCEDQVKPYQEQVRILSQTLEQVSKAVDALTAKPVSSLSSMASYSFAVVMDTVRPMSQQQQLLLIKKKLDSAKIKIDSLNRIIQKQKSKT